MTKPQRKFAIGDRVAERPKHHGLFAVRKEVQDAIAKYRSQRYGTIVNIKYKADASGRKRSFLVIQWDHLTTPCEHSQMRICHMDDFERIMNESCAAIGE
jgi:hypothetical protein